MRYLLSFIALLACSVPLMEQATACSCAPPPPPKQALAQAEAVFSGKVTDITIKDHTKFVTIEVDRVWKGTVAAKVVITTPEHGATCGYGFTTKGDATYLVYCYKNEKGLATNLCTRTTALGNAKEDLKELGDGEKPKEEKKE